MTTCTPEQLTQWLGIRFSDRQLEAIMAPMQPSVIMAGAGSGKTAVMTARIVWLVATGQVEPQQVLGLTFTNKAAAEFRSRVRAAIAIAIPGASDNSTITTYHSFAQQLLIDDGIRIGIEPDVTLLPDVRREQLAMRVVRKPEHPIEVLSHATTSVVQQVLSLDGRLAEEAVSIESVRSHDLGLLQRLDPLPQQVIGRKIIDAARRRLELLALVEQFRSLKRQQQAIDYADMVRLAVDLVTQREDVASRLRRDFRVVLLDEYQDTSVAQRLLMQTAFGDAHPITAVGDALQAIYEWRGASADNIIDFPQHFPRADGALAQVYGLPATQRFGPRLAELANDITADLRPTLPGTEPLQSADALRNGPGLVDVALHADAESEFAWMAQQLRASHPETPWEDMAVLLREHKHAPAVLDALAAARIPAYIVGKQGLLQVPDIADVVSYLRAMHSPAANPAWVRILSGPRYRLGARDLAHLGQRASALAAQYGQRPSGWEQALAEAALGSDTVDLVALGDAVAEPGDAPLSADARERLAALHAEIRYLRRYAGLPAGELVRLVVRTIGLDIEVEASDRAVERGRRAALDAFMELVSSFTSLDGAQSLSDFLRWLDDGERLKQQAQIEQPVVHGAVAIMTVHAAKGLQRKVIALPALVEGSFPSDRGDQAWPTNADALPFSCLRTGVDAALLDFPSPQPKDKEAKAFADALRPRKLAEETRLAYVAVTRAEQRLIASAARVYGDREFEPSRYLEQIRNAAQSRGGVVHLWADPPELHVDARDQVRAPWPQQLDASYRERLLCAATVDISEEPTLSRDAAAEVAAWDAAILAREQERRVERAGTHDVPVPLSLTASEAQRLLSDPDAFLLQLVRPMPAAPARAAKRGSAFHAWIERQFAGQLVLGDDLVDARDDDAEFAALRAAFEASEWAGRTPLAVEVPFVVSLGAHVVRGRVDAVYRDGDGLIVVDWKTNARAASDPTQLVVYRHAMARRYQLPVDQVRACFVYVAQGRTEWHDGDAALRGPLA